MPVHIRTIRLSHINLYSDISTDKARNLTSNGIDKDTMQTNNDFRQTNLKKVQNINWHDSLYHNHSRN